MKIKAFEMGQVNVQTQAVQSGETLAVKTGQIVSIKDAQRGLRRFALGEDAILHGPLEVHVEEKAPSGIFAPIGFLIGAIILAAAIIGYNLGHISMKDMIFMLGAGSFLLAIFCLVFTMTSPDRIGRMFGKEHEISV